MNKVKFNSSPPGLPPGQIPIGTKLHRKNDLKHKIFQNHITLHVYCCFLIRVFQSWHSSVMTPKNNTDFTHCRILPSWV